MPGVTIEDIKFIPDKFTKYALQRTTALSRLIKAGIFQSNPEVQKLINGSGGQFITMPYFKPLTGEDEIFGEDPVGIEGITTGTQTATLLMRQKAWSDTDLSAALSGEDPIGAISDLVGDWWTEREQILLLSILKGILHPTEGALKNHVNDISSKTGEDSYIGVNATLDTKQTLGDAAGKLGLVIMHSAVYTYLQKCQQITTITDAETKISFDKYLNYIVLVDDGIAPTGDVYTTYFMGQKAFIREDGTPNKFKTLETDRDSLSAMNYLINRRAFIIHPNGLSWENRGSYLNPKHTTPTNDDLAIPTNWALTVDAKNVPIAALVHKIK